MAKASGGKGSASSKAPAGGSAGKAGSGDVAQQAKASVKGNGNRMAQAELDLIAEEPEEPEAAESTESAEPAAAPGPAPGEPALPGPPVPTMRELGISGKEMWKVDLKGKRIALDEKTWREELARALGRAPAKP